MSPKELSKSLQSYGYPSYYPHRAVLASASKASEFEAAVEEHFLKNADALSKKYFGLECAIALAEGLAPEVLDEPAMEYLRRPAFEAVQLQALYVRWEELPQERRAALQEATFEGCLRRLVDSPHLARKMEKDDFCERLQARFLQAFQEQGHKASVQLPGLDELPACVVASLCLALDAELPLEPGESTEAHRERAEQLLGCPLDSLLRRELPVDGQANLRNQHAFERLLLFFPREQRASFVLDLDPPPWGLVGHCVPEDVAQAALEGFIKHNSEGAPEEPRDTLCKRMRRDGLGGPPWVEAARSLVRLCAEKPWLREGLLELILGFSYTTTQEPIPTEALPRLLGLLDLPDEDYRITVLTALSQMPINEGLPLVEEAYREASPEVRRVLLRQYAWWARREGREELLEELAAKAEAPEERAAIQTARSRIHPDWPQLVGLRPLLKQANSEGPQGLSFFDDPLRQEEAEALLQLVISNQWRWSISQKSVGMCFEPLLQLFLTLAVQGEYPGFGFFNLSDVQRALGADFAGLASALLRAEQEPPDVQGLYEFCSDTCALGADIHAMRVRSSTGKAQKYAYQKLAECKEEALPYCLELLREKKAGMRMVGIRALHLMALPEAVPHMKEAYGKERSSKCKQALEEAIAHSKADAEEIDLGVYTRSELLEESDALEQLREILSVDPSPETWVRTCDILQRCMGTPTQELALDYLKGHDISRWPHHDRLLPWGWEAPELLELGTRSEGWVPVSTFFLAQSEAFVAETLGRLENRQHRRKLPVHLIDAFLSWLEVAWRWCEQNQIPLDWLEARLDGGCYKGAGRPGATHLSLWRQFGLQIDRGPAFSGYIGGEDIRWIQIRLPKDHPYRELYPLRSGNRYLDLRDIFGDLSEARAALDLD